MNNMKQYIKEVLSESLEYALYQAEEDTRDLKDDGACNFDKCLVKKPETVTYAEFDEILNSVGTPFERMRGMYRGFYMIGALHGMGNRNTEYARRLAELLEEECFDTSVFYQID